MNIAITGSIITTIIVLVVLVTAATTSAQSVNSTSQQQATEFRVQNTSMSKPAPNINCTKSNSTSCPLIPHQIVVALPVRSDGKIWTGTVTFTASKPIEIEILHRYNPSIIPDTVHGQPYNAKWIDGNRYALSTMTMFSNTPVSVTNTPISTGSLVFTGSILLFHKTDGVPFTVTYTIDAVAKSLTG
ncbi:MAG TPA: hypothetical protein VE089_07520 [Nitrososphaeraceae archaeon]|jgi:hypothetical protein|nr:hypothetical protein [Nitrososphaeraceae archaeon]